MSASNNACNDKRVGLDFWILQQAKWNWLIQGTIKSTSVLQRSYKSTPHSLKSFELKSIKRRNQKDQLLFQVQVLIGQSFFMKVENTRRK